MARIAYILLSHKDPDGIIAQARRLTAAGDYIAIHYDARSPREDFEKIRNALEPNPAVTFARRRVKCGWGEWSLVDASLQAIRAAVKAFPRATHFYMLSGDCMPIKTAEFAHAYLDAEDVDFIESVDFFDTDWIKTGIREERLIYRHYFNERSQKRWFYTSMNLQRRLGLARKVPADLQMMIGSQWWCLRRRTIEMVLDFCDRRRDVMRFLPDHLDPGRDLLPDAGPPPRPRGRDPLALADLPAFSAITGCRSPSTTTTMTCYSPRTISSLARSAPTRWS